MSSFSKITGKYIHLKNNQETSTIEHFTLTRQGEFFILHSDLFSSKKSIHKEAHVTALLGPYQEPLSLLILTKNESAQHASTFLCTTDGIEKVECQKRVRKIPLETPFPVVSQFISLRNSMYYIFKEGGQYKLYPGIWIQLSDKPLEPLTMVRLDATLSETEETQLELLGKTWDAFKVTLRLQSASPFPQREHTAYFDTATGISLKWEFKDLDNAHITYQLRELILE